MANVLASGTVSVLPVVTGMVEEALMRWLRAAELTCDRAALLVAQVCAGKMLWFWACGVGRVTRRHFWWRRWAMVIMP